MNLECSSVKQGVMGSREGAPKADAIRPQEAYSARGGPMWCGDQRGASRSGARSYKTIMFPNQAQAGLMMERDND